MGWIGSGSLIAIEIQIQNYYYNIWDKQPNGLDPCPLDLSLASLHNPQNLGKKKKKKKEKQGIGCIGCIRTQPINVSFCKVNPSSLGDRGE
jgi:hypothetical protein